MRVKCGGISKLTIDSVPGFSIRVCDFFVRHAVVIQPGRLMRPVSCFRGKQLLGQLPQSHAMRITPLFERQEGRCLARPGQETDDDSTHESRPIDSRSGCSSTPRRHGRSTRSRPGPRPRS
ncbi:uncharacterized protein PV07_11166 [Cladophialophora immunda]|uniref:Uncharacterized protein n=1 Tax=Cladophialophora immunda TaxID=569365 RepID=A0A0D2BX60_9EURO|nr:uncharacterized protein PV07_11166 [Cladophialophora immunda]KIW22920.1 hypothetical protein PV07_11166 [Cladophialophora immunda]